MSEPVKNLFTILRAVSTPDTVEYFLDKYNTCQIRYGDLKKQLAEDIIKTIAPIRERIEAIKSDDAYLHRVTEQGAERARISADKTLREVREIMGIHRF